jgi:hypothetical protein
MKLSQKLIEFAATISLCFLIFALLLGFYGSFNFGMGFNQGQISVVDHIAHHEGVMINLSSYEKLSELRKYFPEPLNYTDLLIWESKRLIFTERRVVHTDPIEILTYGKGACGEFSIMYTAICLANGIPARIVVPGYILPKVVDHTWVEINPSRNNKTWIHIEPTDSCVQLSNGHSLDDLQTINNTAYYNSRNFRSVLAFQIISESQVIIIDRTSTYSKGCT